MSLAAYIIIFAFSAITLFVLLLSLLHYLAFAKFRQFRHVLAVAAATAILLLASGAMIGIKTCGLVIEQFARARTQTASQARERAARHQQQIHYLRSAVSASEQSKIPPWFYEFRGGGDWWRLPLVYPYQLVMLDDFYLGGLKKYTPGQSAEAGKSSPELVAFITKIAFDRRLLLFQRNTEMNNADVQEWGIFEFSAGRCAIFASESAMFKAALDQDYEGELKLHSLLYHYRNHAR